MHYCSYYLITTCLILYTCTVMTLAFTILTPCQHCVLRDVHDDIENITSFTAGLVADVPVNYMYVPFACCRVTDGVNVWTCSHRHLGVKGLFLQIYKIDPLIFKQWKRSVPCFHICHIAETGLL